MAVIGDIKVVVNFLKTTTETRVIQYLTIMVALNQNFTTVTTVHIFRSFLGWQEGNIAQHIHQVFWLNNSVPFQNHLFVHIGDIILESCPGLRAKLHDVGVAEM